MRRMAIHAPIHACSDNVHEHFKSKLCDPNLAKESLLLLKAYQELMTLMCHQKILVLSILILSMLPMNLIVRLRLKMLNKARKKLLKNCWKLTNINWGPKSAKKVPATARSGPTNAVRVPADKVPATCIQAQGSLEKNRLVRAKRMSTYLMIHGMIKTF